MQALAEDHRNDILSNVTAIACGIIGSMSHRFWWVDPTGAILISLYIIWSWGTICKNQVSLGSILYDQHNAAALLWDRMLMVRDYEKITFVPVDHCAGSQS